MARAEPHKGFAELLKAYPAGLDRPVQIVPAEAGSEYWPAMRIDGVTECRAPAAGLPGVEILPAMAWREVPSFLAAAAVTVASSEGRPCG
ncbi:hypothetical protein ABZ615_24090 [Streptomyces sp. NPDC007325]|uniref:hypothetical protein n=1 Tax=Streptomyces sp. NPDC007325 TaxID=3154588 RepID=UPI0033C0BD49